MSNSVRPHRRQSTRLLHPWDSPGKSTGVGCHCLLQTFSLVIYKWLVERWVSIKKESSNIPKRRVITAFWAGPWNTVGTNVNTVCSPAHGLPCPGRYTSNPELSVLVSLPNQTSHPLRQGPSLFYSLGLNIRATLISIKWPTKYSVLVGSFTNR